MYLLVRHALEGEPELLGRFDWIGAARAAMWDYGGCGALPVEGAAADSLALRCADGSLLVVVRERRAPRDRLVWWGTAAALTAGVLALLTAWEGQRHVPGLAGEVLAWLIAVAAFFAIFAIGPVHAWVAGLVDRRFGPEVRPRRPLPGGRRPRPHP